MAAFTPGPWIFEEDNYAWVLCGGPGPMLMQIAKCPKKGTPYAEYWPNEADARLISAAPDLYEACKAMERWANHPETGLLELVAVGLKARDAIAKAEGK